MQGNLTFQAAVLRAGKQGIIKPDAAGYYTQCIGGLDIENAGGVIYSSEKARNLFLDNGSLQRRIKERALRGEMGHPRRTADYANDDAWFMRLNEIIEANTCVYWSEIGLDFEYGKKNAYLERPNMVGIMARYRPGGIGGHVLERDLADPSANVSFSIRSFSLPRRQAYQRYYDLQSIVTWDYVTEPGIAQAMKTLSSTMESRTPVLMQECDEQTISSRIVERAVQNIQTPSNDARMLVSSNESRNRTIMEVAGALKIDTGISKPVSIYVRWKP